MCVPIGIHVLLEMKVAVVHGKRFLQQAGDLLRKAVHLGLVVKIRGLDADHSRPEATLDLLRRARCNLGGWPCATVVETRCP
jgi:hypothetical protein